MSLAQPIGHRDALIAEREAILANVAPRHRRRLLGVKRLPILPPITHAITVDCRRPSERKVERVIVQPPRPKVRPAPQRVVITPHRVLDAVAEAFGITASDLYSPSRLRRHAYPRFAAMVLLYQGTGRSTVWVGKRLGNRDPSTVVHGLAKAKRLMATFPDYRHRYEAAHIALMGGVC